MPLTLIIASSKYLSGLSLVELGRLPLAFRPLGVSALYECILDSFDRQFDTVIMTVPSDFDCPLHHLNRLNDLGITLLKVDEDVNVATSVERAVEQAVSMVGNSTEILVTYGDVLLRQNSVVDVPADFMTLRKPVYYHNWGVVSLDGHDMSIKRNTRPDPEDRVISGLFRFSNAPQLLEALRQNSDDWFSSLIAYHSKTPLAALEMDGLIDLCGHFAYTMGRRVAMAPRAFNRLKEDAAFILKRSADTDKMKAEFDWFTRLPRRAQIHTPVVTDFTDCDDGESGYSIQYLPLQTVSNLLIFGALPAYAWERIFDGCDEVLTELQSYFQKIDVNLDPSVMFSALVSRKTVSRVATACEHLGISGDEAVVADGVPMVSVNQLTNLVLSRIPQTEQKHLTIMHGDFCGSNLLFDAATGAIKMIDPRGYYTAGNPTIYGDKRYDIAKLAHSVIGGYDAIIAGHFCTNFMPTQNGLTLDLNIWQNNDARELQDNFLNRSFAGVPFKEEGIPEIMISLFLTMIPLHSDNPDRQKAFLANAYRLAKSLGIGAARNAEISGFANT